MDRGQTGLVAAVGSDGIRPVVWGVGETEADADRDALHWLDEPEGLEYLPITIRAAALVLDGAVAYGEGEEIELRAGVLVARGESV